MKRIAILVVALSMLLLAVPLGAHAIHKTNYRANLDGSQENPPVMTTADGKALFKVLDDGNIWFRVTARGLSDSAFGAHIHGPANQGQNAGILVSLCGGGPAPQVKPSCAKPNGKFDTQGIITPAHLQGITMLQLLQWMSNGKVYVNIHTSNWPGGEIRGAIRAVPS